MAALVMIAALLLLVSGNYWAYGFKKEKKAAMAVTAGSDEETDNTPTVANPTEEKHPRDCRIYLNTCTTILTASNTR